MDVLLFTSGKVMDCLLQLSGQIYRTLGVNLLSEALYLPFRTIVKNEIKCMEKQTSRSLFNPNLSWACQMLPEGHQLRTRLADLLQERVMHPQLTCSFAELQAKPRLEYLQLGK
jgi:hypothetical protein